ncbi:MAG: alpha-ketoacid dehydrogenase subunit beta [Candidatus Hodarchaeales archaeon]|jgi:pyruvate dehydrogenase E1 component beta subunit
MREISYSEAIETVIRQSMEEDSSIIILGEDVHTLRVNLFAKFGKERVISTPISESAFAGAAVTASMAGLKPIVEIMFVDFMSVALDSVLNHASKNFFFSGKKWNVPVVFRVSCGGGYGDGGQHEQSLWGMFAHFPGISVVVPSNPIDAGRLMLSAIAADHPVIFLEHKLLADYWLDYLGIGGRTTVSFDVPKEGVKSYLPEKWTPLPIGKAIIIQKGTDITFISLGVSVHRCLEAAASLKERGISSEIIDLRWVSPLDQPTILESVKKTQNLIVVDEDYEQFGLSGEVCAILGENDIDYHFRRVCTKTIIPYNKEKEDQTLPNTERILEAVYELLEK